MTDSGRSIFNSCSINIFGLIILCHNLRVVYSDNEVDRVWNVRAHAQKTDFVFRRNRRVHLNRRGRQFNRLPAAEVCASAVVMLDTPCSEVMWRVLATYSIRLFPLYFPSRASSCAITFQLGSNTIKENRVGGNTARMGEMSSECTISTKNSNCKQQHAIAKVRLESRM